MQWEISGLNGNLNYESFFDKPQARQSEHSYVQDTSQHSDLLNMSNSENYNSMNIPKYQPFSKRFSDRVQKISNSKSNRKRLPPVSKNNSFISQKSTKRSLVDAKESVMSPQMQYYNKCKKITQDMRSKVLGMLEERKADKVGSIYSTFHSLLRTKNHDRDRERRLLLHQVEIIWKKLMCSHLQSNLLFHDTQGSKYLQVGSILEKGVISKTIKTWMLKTNCK